MTLKISNNLQVHIINLLGDFDTKLFKDLASLWCKEDIKEVVREAYKISKIIK